MTTETLYFPVGNIYEDVREDSTDATRTIETIPVATIPVTWNSLDEDIIRELNIWESVSDADLEYLEI